MSEAQDKLLQGEMNMTLNMTMMTSARDAVGKCLATLGGEYDNMLVLTADVDTSSRIQAFKEKYPDRCYNVGIAEQNLMSVSAGLAHEGFRPLAFAFAPFASMRCYEQVRTDICYSKLPVVIIGNGAGYSVREIIETARRITGKEIKAVVEPRRGGDPSVLIASNKKAAEVLGWKPVLGLDQIISDAWAWHSGHPNGYEG